MKVFISWSGPRSQHIATSLRHWLRLVVQNVDPWVSKADIDAGGRWGTEIDDALQSIDYGIIVMTPGHVEKPWLMFEAGALSKRIDKSRVVPYCYDMAPAEIPPGPLTRFQGVAADLEGTLKLVAGMANAMRERQENVLPEAQLEELARDLWPKLKKELDATPSEKTVVAPTRTTDDMVKEILETVRTLARNNVIAVPTSIHSELSHAAARRQLSNLFDWEPAAGEDQIVQKLVAEAQSAIDRDSRLQLLHIQVVALTRTSGGMLLTVLADDGRTGTIDLDVDALTAVNSLETYRRLVRERARGWAGAPRYPRPAGVTAGTSSTD